MIITNTETIPGYRITAVLGIAKGNTVRAKARIAYVSEYDDEYLIGADFETFDDDGQALWQRYLASAGTRQA